MGEPTGAARQLSWCELDGGGRALAGGTVWARGGEEGDIGQATGTGAEAARIFATAYEKDPEFYGFVRSLEAYRKTLSGNTTMVLSPDHVFLRNLQPQLKGMGPQPVSSSR